MSRETIAFAARTGFCRDAVPYVRMPSWTRGSASLLFNSWEPRRQLEFFHSSRENSLDNNKPDSVRHKSISV